MKTIEDTALEIARYAYDFEKADKEWLIGNLALMIRNSLEEQRAIYIDKACDWIMDELRNPKADTFQEFVDNFRKAMEE